MTQYDKDLLVIGGGSGGVRAARIAAQHGARVAIAESANFGGTCVNRGCVPKKLMVYASRFPEQFRASQAFGWTQGEPPRFDWAHFLLRKDAEIARLESIYERNLQSAGWRPWPTMRRWSTHTRCACATAAGRSAPAPSWLLPGDAHRFRSSQATNWRSRRTKSFTCPSARSGC
jgi:glycine/D-amino acid oxidase-like deaminating enzyme